MTRSDVIPLRRLIKQRKVIALLQDFAALMPKNAPALVGADGRLFAHAGVWPGAAVTEMLAGISKPNNTPDCPYRYYRLCADTRFLGVLAVQSGPVNTAPHPLEQALYHSLELLLTEALAKRDIASSTLDRYRELNLLYRAGETIGTALNPALIPKMLLEESQNAIQIDAGVVWLSMTSNEESPAVKASFGADGAVATLYELVCGKLNALLSNGRPAIITELPGPYSTLLWAPLRTAKRVLGWILLARTRKQPIFTASDEKLLVALTWQSALALENAHLFTQTDEMLAQRVNELTALQRIDRQLNENLDYGRVLTLTAEFAATHTGAKQASLLLLGKENGSFTLASRYPSEQAEERITIDDADTLLTQVMASGRAQCAELEADGALFTRVCVPILREGRPIGLLDLRKDGSCAFDSDGLVFLSQLADRSALAIDNAILIEKVQAANNAKTEFVSMVSHELKVPMTSIRGFAAMLSMAGTLSEEQQRFVKVIINNVDRMKVLVSDLSDVSRIESGRLHLAIAEADFMCALREAIEGTCAQIKARGHTLCQAVPPSLPPVLIDHSRTVQVLVNLLSNAYKYTPDGGTITITVEVEHAALRCTVADTGIGMTEAELAKLGNKFWRADHGHVTEQAGTGLGMNITKGIIELQGGTLEVCSTPDMGSAFTFTVPRAR